MKKIFLVIVCSFFLLILGNFVLAATNTHQDLATIKFTPSVAMPGFNEQTIDSGSIARYINAAYKYGAGVAGIVAMFMIVFASWQWIIASGNSGKIDNAKETITGALIGLAFLLGGNLLLGQISSGLVEFNNLDVTPVDGVAQCEGDKLPSEVDCGQDIQCVDEKGQKNVRFGHKCGPLAPNCVYRNVMGQLVNCPDTSSGLVGNGYCSCQTDQYISEN